MLMQQIHPQLVRPPIAVRRPATGTVLERTLRLSCHEVLPGAGDYSQKPRSTSEIRAHDKPNTRWRHARVIHRPSTVTLDTVRYCSSQSSAIDESTRWFRVRVHAQNRALRRERRFDWSGGVAIEESMST